MLKSIGLSIIALMVASGLTFGQGRIWSLAEIERTIPYGVVLNSVPGLTYDEYATASVRIMLVLNGDMSPDKLLALSADQPLVVRASIAIVDALLAENTKRLKLKRLTASWVAGLIRCSERQGFPARNGRRDNPGPPHDSLISTNIEMATSNPTWGEDFGLAGRWNDSGI